MRFARISWPPRSTAIPAAALLLISVSVCGLIAHRISEGNAVRKRDSDAVEIGNALVVYQAKHNGSLPPSLDALEIDRSVVDVTPFRLLPPETRAGRMDSFAIAEGPALNSEFVIRIYRDGQVKWE